jgi:hypothetical protein
LFRFGNFGSAVWRVRPRRKAACLFWLVTSLFRGENSQIAEIISLFLDAGNFSLSHCVCVAILTSNQLKESKKAQIPCFFPVFQGF